ncbi:MAG: glycosyl hydrolase, partial [Deltaproteobacteria bacterium]|nr:glycosyl hydrolase [Deltaproteobacteria bacterium]
VAMKSVVVKSAYQWSDNETAWRAARQTTTHKGHDWQDLIIYEVHPKGFTASPASGVEHPGTYRGLGEKADYFKDLGITAVELLPVMEKPLDGGYWGYQTLGFFAPELTYSSDTRPGMPMDEFKWMVDELHKRGLEVILDVVYNHTGEGGLWRDKIALNNSPDPGNLGNYDPKEVAGLYSFRGLDNSGYYALSPDNQTYWNNTGVGDETRCNNTPMKRLILDSLHYWATEMHVDGFRFDLAPILAEQDKNYNSFDPANQVTQAIIDDPVLQRYNTRIIAEPWSLYGAFVSGFPASTSKGGTGWSEWNGRFRDWWRAFVNNDSWNLSSQEGPGGDGGFLLTGSYDWFHWNGRRPYNSINFVTVHDGFTMYDVFSYNQKLNGCGPLNPVCCDSPNSPFCTRDDGESNNRSRDWGQGAEDFKRQLMRNLFTAMMVAQGTPMILGGDEWMRTQLGNNNAYSTESDNPYNWYDWGAWQANDEKTRMHDFVRKLTQFRASHAYAFAASDYGSTAPFSWKNETNTGAPNWNGKHLMMHFYDSTKGKQLAILINMEGGQVNFTLPSGVAWERVLDTQQSFDTAAYLSANSLDTHTSQNIALSNRAPIAGSYGVATRSIVVLEEAQ